MASPASPYWAVAAETLLRRLDSSTTGLSSTDAVNRLQEHGPNQVREQARLTRLGVLLSQLRSPLLLVLVFAAVASGLTGEWVGRGHRPADRRRHGRSGLSPRIQRAHRGRRAAGPCACPDAQSCATAGTTTVDNRISGARRCRAAVGRQPRPCRRRHPGGDGLLRQRSRADRRELSGREAPGVVAARPSLRDRTNCVFLGTNVRSGTARCLIANRSAAPSSGRSRTGSPCGRPKPSSIAASGTSATC